MELTLNSFYLFCQKNLFKLMKLNMVRRRPRRRRRLLFRILSRISQREMFRNPDGREKDSDDVICGNAVSLSDRSGSSQKRTGNRPGR